MLKEHECINSIQDFIDFLKNNKSKSVDLLISDIGIQKALKQSEENTKLKKGNEVTDTATKNDSSYLRLN